VPGLHARVEVPCEQARRFNTKIYFCNTPLKEIPWRGERLLKHIELGKVAP
jgi:hypothetical protein